MKKDLIDLIIWLACLPPGSFPEVGYPDEGNDIVPVWLSCPACVCRYFIFANHSVYGMFLFFAEKLEIHTKYLGEFHIDEK